MSLTDAGNKGTEFWKSPQFQEEQPCFISLSELVPNVEYTHVFPPPRVSKRAYQTGMGLLMGTQPREVREEVPCGHAEGRKTEAG